MTPPAPHPAPGSGRTLALDEFPKELIEEMLGYLDLGDQQALRRTSRRFKEVYDASPTLQYALELERCRFRPVKSPAAVEGGEEKDDKQQSGTDNKEEEGTRVLVSRENPHTWVELSRTSLGFADCIDTIVPRPTANLSRQRAYFLSREERWNSLTPVATRAMRMEGHCERGMMVLNGGKLMLIGDDAPPTIIPLPSAANPDLASPPSAGTSAYPPELDRISQHGSIDPEQDLVVAGKGPRYTFIAGGNSSPDAGSTELENTLQLSIMTMGMEPHPLAAEPTLCSPQLSVPLHAPSFAGILGQSCSGCLDLLICKVQILGSTVAVLVAWYIVDPAVCRGRRELPALLLWNWKTGVQFGYHVGHPCNSPASTFPTFTLLTEHSVLFINPPSGERRLCLSMWTFPLPSDNDNQSRHYRPDPSPQNKYLSQGICVAELYLPKTRPTVDISVLQCSGQRSATFGEPYAPDTRRGVLRIPLTDLGRNWINFELYVLIEYLLEIVERGQERAAASPYPVFITSEDDGKNPAGPCFIYGCQCCGVSGTPQEAGSGFHRAPHDHSTLSSHKDEKGRAYTCRMSDTVCRTYEFTEWGIKHTRILPHLLPRVTYDLEFSCRPMSTVGYRDAYVNKDPVPRLFVRNFAPGAVAAFRKQMQEREAQTGIGATGAGAGEQCGGQSESVECGPNVVEPAVFPPDSPVEQTISEYTVLSPDIFWAEEVRSELAYTETVRPLRVPDETMRLRRSPPPAGRNWVMLDEQRIIVGATKMIWPRDSVDNTTPGGHRTTPSRTEMVVMCM